MQWTKNSPSWPDKSNHVEKGLYWKRKTRNYPLKNYRTNCQNCIYTSRGRVKGSAHGRTLMIGKHFVGLLFSGLLLLHCSCFGPAVKPSTMSAVSNLVKQVEEHDKTIKENSGIISEIHSKVITNTSKIVTLTLTEQHTNNPWPWMIAAIIQLPCFLAFLWFSHSWKGGRGL